MSYSLFTTVDKHNYTIDQVVNYVKTFNKHNLKINMQKSFEYTGLFYTEHSFPNGLILSLVWFCKERPLKYNYFSIEDLCFLKDKSIISLRDFHIVRPCKEKYTTKDYVNVPRKCLSKEDYRLLEYATSSDLKLAPSVYDSLAEEINNQVLFEQYCQNKKKPINP